MRRSMIISVSLIVILGMGMFLLFRTSGDGLDRVIRSHNLFCEAVRVNDEKKIVSLVHPHHLHFRTGKPQIQAEKKHLVSLSRTDVLFFIEQDEIRDGKTEHVAVLFTRNKYPKKTIKLKDGTLEEHVFPFRIYGYMLRRKAWLFFYTHGMSFDATNEPSEADFRRACLRVRKD